MGKRSFKVIIISVGVVIAVCLATLLFIIVSSGMNSSKKSSDGQASSSESLGKLYNPRSDYKTQLQPNSAIWSEELTFGNAAAKSHFIEYTDMFCPYCAKFNLALHGAFDEFKRDFLDTNKIQLEVRLVSLITDHENSDKGGSYAYCAAKQGKFKDFYPAMLEKINTEYFAKGIGSSHDAPDIPILEDSFFSDVAKDVGADMAKVESCMAKGEGKKSLGIATATAQRSLPSGVPYFIFNNYKTSGFEGDFSRIKQMFKAGGVS
jgi:protein-disulfide isomerase